MSQKVRIDRVSVRGATPFLGEDEDGEPIYSRASEDIALWLCRAWRLRFNQRRSRRFKVDGSGRRIPLSENPDTRTMSEARAQCPTLEGVPSMILQSPEKLEAEEWDAALRRKESVPGSGLPGFKSARCGQKFACWFNSGKSATLQMVSARKALVVIGGMVPKARQRDEELQRFTIRLHVRISEPIREYSSIRVNWTKRELVFVNDPAPVRRVEEAPTGRALGIDLGIVHAVATSEGDFYDLPREKLQEIARRLSKLQSAQARSFNELPYETWAEFRAAGIPRRYKKRQDEIRRLRKKARSVREDCHQKVTTDLVKRADAVALEDLNLRGMRSGELSRGKQNSINRGLEEASLSQLMKMLEYKSERAGVRLVRVDSRGTSTTCAVCGYWAENNRPRRDLFLCQKCGHRADADTHAARNVIARASWLAEGI